MLKLLIFIFLLVNCEKSFDYDIWFNEIGSNLTGINRNISVYVTFENYNSSLCFFNITVTSNDQTFSVKYDSSQNENYYPNGTGYIFYGSSLSITLVRQDNWNLNLLNFTCATTPFASSKGCPLDLYANNKYCLKMKTSLSFDQTYVDTLFIRNGSVDFCSDSEISNNCSAYAPWWTPGITYPTTLSLTTTETLTTSQLISTSHTDTEISTTTASPTTQSNTSLSDLANQGVGLNNITDVLDTTYKYSIMGAELNSSEISDIATILNNCANLVGISAENSVQILSNIDYIMNANESQLNNSTQNLLKIYGSMVHNTNGSRIEFLNGTNLGFSSKRIDCQNLGQNDGLVDLGSTFQLINYTSNIHATSLNGIIIPLEDICQSTSLTHMFFTIYRDRKLFTGEQKHRIFDNQNMENHNVLDDDGPEEDDPPSRCLPQIALTSDAPVLCATLMNNGKEISRISSEDNENQVMANLQFNIKKIPNPLHGKFEVTWWNTSSNQWSNDMFCKITKKTNDIINAECSHLTDFTVIVVGSLDDQVVCDQTLAIIGYIVNSFSIISLSFLTIISSLVFMRSSKIKQIVLMIKGEEQKDGDVIVLFYYSSLLLFYLIFVFFSDRKNQTLPDIGCTITASIMYFLLICTIMLNIIQGIRIVKQWSYSTGKLSYYISKITSTYWAIGICVGLPAILCILLSTLDLSFFERNDSFCWIRPDYIISAIVIPISILLLNTSICTVLIVYRMFFSRRKKLSNKDVTFYDAEFWSKISSIIIMEIALGAPWIIQYFTLAWPTTTFWNYLFTIVLGSQGTLLLMIFLYKRQKIYRSFSSKQKLNKSSKN